jgi:hypothetical protein
MKGGKTRAQERSPSSQVLNFSILDHAGQELNAAQIDKLTEFLEQEGQVKVAKYFGSRWY